MLKRSKRTPLERGLLVACVRILCDAVPPLPYVKGAVALQGDLARPDVPRAALAILNGVAQLAMYARLQQVCAGERLARDQPDWRGLRNGELSRPRRACRAEHRHEEGPRSGGVVHSGSIRGLDKHSDTHCA